MTITDRIIEHLAVHPGGADDDELAKALELKCRQQVNDRCCKLASQGIIRRRSAGKSSSSGNAKPEIKDIS